MTKYSDALFFFPYSKKSLSGYFLSGWGSHKQWETLKVNFNLFHICSLILKLTVVRKLWKNINLLTLSFKNSFVSFYWLLIIEKIWVKKLRASKYRILLESIFLFIECHPLGRVKKVRSIEVFLLSGIPIKFLKSKPIPFS